MVWHDLPDFNLNNLGLIVSYLQYKSDIVCGHVGVVM